MQLKNRLKTIEKRFRFDRGAMAKKIKAMSDEELAAISNRYKERCPNKCKALQQVISSLSDEELEYLSGWAYKFVSNETLVRLYKVQQIEG